MRRLITISFLDGHGGREQLDREQLIASSDKQLFGTVISGKLAGQLHF